MPLLEGMFKLVGWIIPLVILAMIILLVEDDELIRTVISDILKKNGYSVDTALLRRDYPEVGWHTYEAWAKEQDWKQTLSG